MVVTLLVCLRFLGLRPPVGSLSHSLYIPIEVVDVVPGILGPGAIAWQWYTGDGVVEYLLQRFLGQIGVFF